MDEEMRAAPAPAPAPASAPASAPPPYGTIARSLKRGEVVPFLGAGTSLVGRQTPEAKFDPDAPGFLPSGAELARALAEESGFPSTDPADRQDLAKVCSYFADISGRTRLRQRLRELLCPDAGEGGGASVAGPGALHRLLASVPSPMVIVTTNYDTLIEQALEVAARPYDLVIYPADLKRMANAVIWWPHGATKPEMKPSNELDIDLAKTTVLFKMHGTIHRQSADWDSFVITEEDYVEFLSRMTTHTAVPSLFFPHFQERSFLFLGYSLRDWNLRVLLRNLSKHLTARTVRTSVAGSGASGTDTEEQLPSWAIQRQPSELERRLWSKRHVNIFDVSLDEFVRELEKRMLT